MSCYDDNELYVSIPCVINREGIKEKLDINLNEEKKKMLNKSKEIIKGVIEESK